MNDLRQAESSIQNRNGLVTMLFGGDSVDAAHIDSVVQQDLASLDAMDKIVNDPSTSATLKAFVQQREEMIRAELTRLQGVASSEMQKKGLFSGLIGK